MLIVAVGLNLNYNKIEGATEALTNDPRVCSNFSPQVTLGILMFTFSIYIAVAIVHQSSMYSTVVLLMLKGNVNEYPIMHYFGNPRHTQSMKAYMILTKNFWKFK